MEIIEALRREHDLLDEVAGSLLAWAVVGSSATEAQMLRRDLVRFFGSFLVNHHHRVEAVLFTALVQFAEVPGDRGPLAILRREHRAASSSVNQFAAAPAEEAVAIARELAADLRQHLDKENSVLLMEAERRLADGGLRRLAPPTPTVELAAIEELGADLARRLPPAEDEDLVRGDGCIPCPSFALDCSGIESEWWSEWERSHYAGLDEG